MTQGPPKEGDLEVWWIPQVPMKAFYVRVSDLAQGELLVNALADYDRFQYENNIKPDYANMGGLEIFKDGEWSEWYDHESGDDFDTWRRDRKQDSDT